MNVIDINTKSTQLALSEDKLAVCGKECKGYISASNIQVTTCGNKITSVYDPKHSITSVIPQRNTVDMIEYPQSGITEIHSTIDQQPVVAIASTAALKNQQLFNFCERKNITRDTIIYSGCKHVKFLIHSGDISIAK